jgi:hypothetical protein
MSHDATMSDINVLTEAIAKLSINHSTAYKDATMTDVEDLTKTMSSTNIENGQHVYIPPGTSLDDKLLLFAGADLNLFSFGSDTSTSLSGRQVFGHAAHKSFKTTVPAEYGHFLDHEGQDLANAALHQNINEVYDLSRGISDVLWTMHHAGRTKVVFSPRDSSCLSFLVFGSSYQCGDSGLIRRRRGAARRMVWMCLRGWHGSSFMNSHGTFPFWVHVFDLWVWRRSKRSLRGLIR